MPPRSRYIEQLDYLESAINKLADKTTADVTAAGLALVKGDAAAATEVLEGDQAMRRLRASIEDTCLDIMLMQQPLVAGDLRYVTGAFRLVSDLAHIGAKARDVAFLATQIPAGEVSAIESDIASAAGKVAFMTRTAVRSFCEADSDLSESVFRADDEVDALYKKMESEIIDMIRAGEVDVAHLPELLMAAKYFERMGDDAERIAKWTIFRITGQRGTSVSPDMA